MSWYDGSIVSQRIFGGGAFGISSVDVYAPSRGGWSHYSPEDVISELFETSKAQSPQVGGQTTVDVCMGFEGVIGLVSASLIGVTSIDSPCPQDWAAWVATEGTNPQLGMDELGKTHSGER